MIICQALGSKNVHKSMINMFIKMLDKYLY